MLRQFVDTNYACKKQNCEQISIATISMRITPLPWFQALVVIGDVEVQYPSNFAVVLAFLVSILDSTDSSPKSQVNFGNKSITELLQILAMNLYLWHCFINE